MRIVITSWLFVLVTLMNAAETTVLYSNNFEGVEVGTVPQEFMILDGAWKVKEENGNKILESPGIPLDSYALLLGPNTNASVCVSARVYGTATGKRCPVFGIGLNGVGGYKLQVSPGRRQLELFKGDELVKAIPYAWNTNGWTVMKLQIRKTGDAQCTIEGKAWGRTPEPTAWSIVYQEKAVPPAGRASLWATPISGTPVKFDDVMVTTTAQNL